MLAKLVARRDELVNEQNQLRETIGNLQANFNAYNGAIGELERLIEELKGEGQPSPIETIMGDGQNG